MSVEDILRPLVEATVECFHVQTQRGQREVCLTCGAQREFTERAGDDSAVSWAPGSIPDPRFEALRLKNPTLSEPPTFFPWNARWGRIDASLEAIVGTAEVCGLTIGEFLIYGGRVTCKLFPFNTDKWHWPAGSGDSAREAFANALVASVIRIGDGTALSPHSLGEH